MAFRKLFLFSSFLLILSLFFSTGSAQEVTLKIVETTDVHGAVFPYDFINDSKSNGSLAQIHTYVKKERKKKRQEVLLLSAGDILQGQPFVYYYNFERTDGIHPYAKIMNYMGYSAGAVGNHDIEPGHEVYDKFEKELDFPWLAANAVKKEKGESYFEPYTIIKKQGIKIAILGMVTPGIPNWLPPVIWEGMQFEDMIETARKWVPIIQQKEKPHLLLGLFHSGVDFTYGGQNAQTLRNENGAKLVAEQVPGFDIVFVGHDHRLWNTTTQNAEGQTVHILGAGAHARDVAVATVKLTFSKIDSVWQKKISSEIVGMKEFKPDSQFMKEFAAEFDEVKTYVSRPIGSFTKKMSSREALFGSAEFTDLVHRIQLELTGAELSITAPLSSNAQIDSGDVSVRDMFKLYKYENLLYTMKLSGQEIKDFLEYSYAGWFNQMSGSDDHLLNFKENSQRLQIPAFNFDSMAGLEYVVDVSKPAGKRVHILAVADGSMFDFGRSYTVAVNSYRGNGGGGHLTEGAGIAKEDLPDRIESATEKDLRYFLMKWIEEQREVTPISLGNWHVIPQDWWETAKERDTALLFSNN